MMRALFFLLLSTQRAASWPRVPCDAPPAGAASSAAALLSHGSGAAARACLVLAGAASKYDERALRAIARAQSVALAADASSAENAAALSGVNVTAVFDELVGLMASKNILTLPELDALETPLDVLVLHGQLACLVERTAGALASFHAALRLRESPPVRELVARIALGRGDARGARVALQVALDVQMRTRTQRAERAGTRTLALQAELRLAASAPSAQLLGVDGTGAVTRVGGANQDAIVSKSVWCEVRDSLRQVLARLGAALPPGDPLSPSTAYDEDEDFDGDDYDDDDDCSASWVSGRGPAIVNRGAPALAAALSFPLKTSAAAAEAAAWTASGTAAAAASWGEKGYATLTSVLPPAYFTALRERAYELFVGGARGREHRIEHDVPQSRDVLWNEELSLFVGLRLLPLIRNITKSDAVSTYTFFIRYEAGGVLHPHKDRPQNAISLSLNLGIEPDAAPAWPLWVAPAGKGEDDGVPVRLQNNDALLYGGVDHMHWRRPLVEGSSSMHVIFGFRDVHSAHCNSQ